MRPTISGPRRVFPEVALHGPARVLPQAWPGLKQVATSFSLRRRSCRARKRLILTGNMGEVMQESVRAALSYIRSNARKLGIKGRLL